MQNLMTTFSHTLQFSQFTFSSGLISPAFLGFLPRSWLSAAHSGSHRSTRFIPVKCMVLLALVNKCLALEGR